MARKQKKLTRKERMRQQQGVLARREAKGWVSPSEKARQRTELAEDMAPIGAMLQAGSESDQSEQLFWLLVDSANLAEEPEFKEIIVNPLEAAETFALVGMELGLEPEVLAELPEEEREDKQIELLELTTRRLLTKDLHQEIITALDQLRRRLKQAGLQAETAKAAALQSFLSSRKTSDMWPMLGLTQEVVRRSLEVGVELMVASFEAEESEQLDSDGAPKSILDRLRNSSIDQKFGELLEKTPGLNKFLEKQADQMWAEGMQAIYGGELNLELFTREEIEAGTMMLQALLEEDEVDEADAQPRQRFSEKNIRILIDQFNAYLTERLTPERIEQFRTRLQTILQEDNYPPEYTAFIHMAANNMAGAEVAKYEMPFLLHAFFGEIRATSAIIDELEDDDSSDEDA